MPATKEIATKMQEKQSILAKFASRYSVDPNKMLDTLKNTCFKQKEDGGAVTNEQMIALLVVADQYKLNPFTKEIYAFPDKKAGIIPIVGVDGWSRIINSDERLDGIEFNESEAIITSDEHKDCPAWIECIIYRKDRRHPTKVKEYLDEVYRPPFKGKGRNGDYEITGPWQTHTKRFLRHKALIQCARVAFGFVGIYDQDEAERIVEGETIREEVGKPVVDMPIAASEDSTNEYDVYAELDAAAANQSVGDEIAGD